MKLNEVIQSKTPLKLEKLDKDLIFNNITLADQAWLTENYKDEEELKKVFLEQRIDDILKIAVRFLDDDSKNYIRQVKIIERDEYGEEIETKRLTLAEKLFRICNQSELVAVMKTIFDVRTKSMALIAKLASDFQKKSGEVIPQAEENKENHGK